MTHYGASLLEVKTITQRHLSKLDYFWTVFEWYVNYSIRLEFRAKDVHIALNELERVANNLFENPHPNGRT